MFRLIFFTLLLSSVPVSLLWAQNDNQGSVGPIVTTPIWDYGLIYEEPVQKALPDSMPILNPKNYDAKIQLWSPPFEWFNSMPVIGSPEKKSDSLSYWWIPDLTQKKGNQHK